MTKEGKDKEFLEYVIKAIVNHPEDVKIQRSIDERGVLLSLKVNPKDVGIVIGRKGQTVTAIRTLLKIIGTREKAYVNLRVELPEGRTEREVEENLEV